MKLGEIKGFHGYERTPTQPTFSSGMIAPVDINNIGYDNNNNSDNNNNECIVREQDRFMPIANIIRIMRKILPPHAKISDDAKETIQECVSDYISFITSEANERCQREHRKTITAEDVLWAMSKLGFYEYIEPLTLYLNRYRDLEGDRGSIRAKSLFNRVVDPDPNCMGVSFNGPAFEQMGGYQYPQHQHVGMSAGADGNGFYPQYGMEVSPSQAVPGVEHNGSNAQGNN